MPNPANIRLIFGIVMIVLWILIFWWIYCFAIPDNWKKKIKKGRTKVTKKHEQAEAQPETIVEEKSQQPTETDEEEEERLERERKELWPQYFHRGKIMQSWKAMVDGGKGMDGQFFDNVIKRLNEVKIPNIQVEVRTMYFNLQKTQGRVYTLFWRDVYPIHVCKMFVEARDVGENLSIAWFVLWDGNVWNEHNNDTAAKILYDFCFDVGNKQELNDWIKIVHDIILDEAKKLTSGLNADFSKVGVHTKGFLNLPY